MTKTQAWIHSFRLRTLPLSSAGAVLGTLLAWSDGFFSVPIALLCLLTILLLQILSNMANDLGDSQKGTDNEHRTGPQRAVQSGVISHHEMRKGVILCAILALISGISLLFLSFEEINWAFIALLIIGLGGIAAAIKYTVGKNAYGYNGLGDVFVFFFFGWIPVGIAYFVQTHTWNWLILLPGLAVGLLSTAVLNLNNLRDFENDKRCGKKTLVVKMGVSKGKIYQFALIFGAFISAGCYAILSLNCPFNLLYLLAFVPLFTHLKGVKNTTNLSKLDPELKKVALCTIAMVVLWGVGFALC